VLDDADLYDFGVEEETPILKRRRRVFRITASILGLFVSGVIFAIIFLRLTRGDRLDDIKYAAGIDQTPVKIQDIIPTNLN
jgi:hypothetical protein